LLYRVDKACGGVPLTLVHGLLPGCRGDLLGYVGGGSECWRVGPPPVEYGAIGFGYYTQAIGQDANVGITDATGTMHTLTARIVGIEHNSLLCSAGTAVNKALSTIIIQATEAQGFPSQMRKRGGKTTCIRLCPWERGCISSINDRWTSESI
jgi:hypothetical protein